MPDSIFVEHWVLVFQLRLCIGVPIIFNNKYCCYTQADENNELFNLRGGLLSCHIPYVIYIGYLKTTDILLRKKPLSTIHYPKSIINASHF